LNCNNGTTAQRHNGTTAWNIKSRYALAPLRLCAVKLLFK